MANSITAPFFEDQKHGILFRSTQQFKEFENDLISNTPIANEKLTDIDGNNVGWYIQYEVRGTNLDDNANDSENYAEENFYSLLTYIYSEESQETDIILTDVSKIYSENIVYVIDLKTNEILDEIEIREQLLNPSMDTQQCATRSSNCVWWVCTRRDSVGVGWSNSCLVSANVICSAAKPTAIQVACAGLTALACHIPKNTICVVGYWETNVCPIR